MKVLCILLCVAFASGFYIDNNETHEEKIVGGDYVGIEHVPYQAVVLEFGFAMTCGATIIDKSWVLTATHCVANRTHISVRTGTGHRRLIGEEHRIEKVIEHSDYDAENEVDSIALIELAEPIHFNSNQQPIELAKPHDIPREGELMLISGFGQIGEHKRKSDVIKAAYVPVMNQENCRRAYMPQPITHNMFCAGNGNADSCYGDSGGPGVIHGKLYGIISGGRNCASSIFPAVYIRVHKYYDWIVDKTGSDSKIYKPNFV